MKVPCDCLLIAGSAMMNESSLTGESIPIPKYIVDNNNEIFDIIKNKRNILLEGTHVMKTKVVNDGKNDVLALVLRTGY